MVVWLRKLILSGVEVAAEIDGKIVFWRKNYINILSAQRVIEIWRVVQKMRHKEYLFLKKLMFINV